LPVGSPAEPATGSASAEEPAQQDRYARAIARFDAANAEDPSFDMVDGARRPKALVYADRMTAMLARFVPDESEALELSARCQHIERWKIPRNEYPMTRAGYQAWRARLRDFHADRAAAMLREAGYEDATIDRVRGLIRKERMKADPEAQALEDVVESLVGGARADAAPDPARGVGRGEQQAAEEVRASGQDAEEDRDGLVLTVRIAAVRTARAQEPRGVA